MMKVTVNGRELNGIAKYAAGIPLFVFSLLIMAMPGLFIAGIIYLVMN